MIDGTVDGSLGFVNSPRSLDCQFNERADSDHQLNSTIDCFD